MCYEVSKVVSPIVNSSSPEGIFQDKLGSSKFYFFFFNLIFLWFDWTLMKKSATWHGRFRIFKKRDAANVARMLLAYNEGNLLVFWWHCQNTAHRTRIQAAWWQVYNLLNADIQNWRLFCKASTWDSAQRSLRARLCRIHQHVRNILEVS